MLSHTLALHGISGVYIDLESRLGFCSWLSSCFARRQSTLVKSSLQSRISALPVAGTGILASERHMILLLALLITKLARSCWVTNIDTKWSYKSMCSWLRPLQTVILLRPYSLSRVHAPTESSLPYPGEVVAFLLLINKSILLQISLNPGPQDGGRTGQVGCVAKYSEI
jgi:hypothetical protein